MFKSTLSSAAPDLPFAYLANGVIGFTVARSPLQCGEVRVSGCFGRRAENNTEWIATLPNPFGLDLAVDGRPLIEHAAAFRSQELDFS
ncbi:MAG TPA: hypothetical protein VL359_04410, partial [bacterium]|nr:hypothetical protein [bacterium]